MNAQVDIRVSIQTRQRMWNEPFRPTKTWTEFFHYTTSTNLYLGVTPQAAAAVYAYKTTQNAVGGETTTHVAVRVDNPTHPKPAAGVVPLAKGHRDIALSDGEFASAAILRDSINAVVADLKTRAKY